jgi:hypothetical protein
LTETNPLGFFSKSCLQFPLYVIGLINQLTCIVIFLKAIQDHKIQESKHLVLSSTLYARINFSIINYQ